MATYTPNLDLKKPAGTDYVLVDDFNENSDKVDAAIGDPAQLTTEDKTNLVLAINSASKAGVGLNIKGTYATLEALEAAVTSPVQSDMYNVGLTAPYTVYMWETIAVSPQWVSQGTIKGDPGADGVGVPTGGTTGQVLKKKSDTPHDTEWGAAGSGVPDGGTTGQVLKKQSSTNGDAVWGDAKALLEDTNVIDEISDDDKFIIEDASASAGSKIKHTLWSAIVAALKSIFAPALMANKTIYVATTGSDTTGDGSSGAPYATIGKAKSVIPKCLGGFVAKINLGAGTFTENVSFSDYYGGSIEIVGQGVTTVIAGSVTYIRCTAAIGLVKIYTTASYALVAADARLTISDDITVDCINKAGTGVLADGGAALLIKYGKTLTVNNSNNALYASISDVRSRGTLAGSNNNTGRYADACIMFSGTVTISATTPKTTSNDGQIYP